MSLNFKPEIWSSRILAALETDHIYASPIVVNRDYEGEIRNQGDTVRVRSVSDPTISSHSRGDVITYEQLTDAQRALVIDQGKRFSFAVDDIDAAQTPGGELAVATRRAGYKLRDIVDEYIAGFYTEAQTANQLGTVAVTTAALAYTQIRRLMVVLDKADVPSEGRWIVVPPWYYGLLLEDDRFVRADASGTTEGLRNGYVGDVLGFRVLKSNNVINTTGDDWAVMAGVQAAISFAEQIVKVETLRLQDQFADGVRGLHVYGAKVMRPDCIATVIASET